MTDNNLITVDEFGLIAADFDTSRYGAPTVSGYISSATKIATDYLQYTPFAETITDEVRTATISPEGDLLIFPAKLPIISLTGIKIYKGATEIELTLQDGNGSAKYNIDFARRHVRYPYGEITLQGVPVFSDFYALRGSQFYTKLTYRAGWEPSDLPASIKHAVVLITRDLLSVQYNQSGATRIQQGGISLEFANIKSESKLLKDAKRLLGPYRRVM